MRRITAAVAVLVVATAPCAAAQQGREGAPVEFSLADILAAPFPSGLVVAPDGRRAAWIGDEEGRRNVWVAQAPAWAARRLTRYTADDGQELADLTFTTDGRSLLYTRGGDAGGNHDETAPANPTSDPRGTDQAVWLVSFTGGVPRRIGEGRGPVPSPARDRVVFLHGDTVMTAPLRTRGPARPLFRSRGASDDPQFSPDGRRLAFVSRRGDHSFVGVYDLRANSITWMAPATRRDDRPRWSPDGDRLVFLRRPGGLYATGLPAPAPVDPAPPPFQLMVADPATGSAREAYRSAPGRDGAFPGPAGAWGLRWAAGDRIVFASELTGWLGMYAVAADGGEALRLTPLGCEVEDVALSGALDTLLFASNCGDIDRRHAWRVPVAGGSAEPLTSGAGLEWSPRSVAGGTLVLRSGAREPAAPARLDSAGTPVVLSGWPLPPAFPLEQLVAPQAVVVRAADALEIHLQVFVPPDDGGRRPAMIFMHGGPSREMLLGWHSMQYYHNAYGFNQYLASRGYVVVSVNYRGGVGYGRAFRQAPNRGPFGASEYQDVLAAAAWLRTRPDVDSARIGLWGGSYGGYLTALGLARNSDLFAAGVDLHGVHDYAEERHLTSTWGVSDSAIAVARAASPVADLARWRSPVLLIQGDDDRNVEFSQTVDLARRLQLRGVRVEELVFPDEIHDFLLHANWRRAYRAAAEFLAINLRR